MGLISFVSKILGGKSVPVSGEGWRDDPAIMQMYADACYREMALYTGVDLMARFVSKCEFKTFVGGKEDKDNPDWYRWNIEPNKNQNSSAFLRKLVCSLYYRGECLVIETTDKQLLVADNFTRRPYALYDDIFEQVSVGDYTFNRTFAGNEVLYWNLDAIGNGKTMQALIFCVCESYAKLLAYAMKSYQSSRGSKALFKYEGLPPNVKLEDSNEWLLKQQEKFGRFLSADSGVATVGKGTNLEAYDRKTTYSNETTRDIRHLIDDISDFTAKAIGLHPALLRGDVQDISAAMDFTLTVGVDPLVDMLREEIVRKTYGRSGLAQGYDLIIDTSAVKHVDVLDASVGIDKLVASGVYSINDIRRLLGEPEIMEDWANEHFVTKNYVPFDEALRAAGGGE